MAEKRGLSPRLLRTSPKNPSNLARRMDVSSLPDDAATCKAVFPSLFVARRSDFNDFIISSSFSTICWGAMETARWNAVSPVVLILEVTAEMPCSSYSLTTFLHFSVTTLMYKFKASPSSVISTGQLHAIFFLTIGTRTKMFDIRKALHAEVAIPEIRIAFTLAIYHRERERGRIRRFPSLPHHPVVKIIYATLCFLLFNFIFLIVIFDYLKRKREKRNNCHILCLMSINYKIEYFERNNNLFFKRERENKR